MALLVTAACYAINSALNKSKPSLFGVPADAPETVDLGTQIFTAIDRCDIGTLNALITPSNVNALLKCKPFQPGGINKPPKRKEVGNLTPLAYAVYSMGSISNQNEYLTDQEDPNKKTGGYAITDSVKRKQVVQLLMSKGANPNKQSNILGFGLKTPKEIINGRVYEIDFENPQKSAEQNAKFRQQLFNLINFIPDNDL